MQIFARLAIIAVIVLGISASAEAKKKPLDFSSFRGKYSGTVTIVVGSQVIPGSAQIVVSGPKNGRSMTLTVSGSVSAGGMTLPISNVLIFTASRAFSEADISYNVLTHGVPSSGSFAGKKTFSYSGRFNASGTLGTSSGTLSIRPQGKKKQKLALVSNLQVDGMPTSVTFTFDVSAKVKPSK